MSAATGAGHGREPNTLFIRQVRNKSLEVPGYPPTGDVESNAGLESWESQVFSVSDMLTKQLYPAKAQCDGPAPFLSTARTLSQVI